MSNKVLEGRIVIDSTGIIYGPGKATMITGVSIVPSNATWSVVLEDASGEIIYSANNVGVSVSQLTKPIFCRGLEVATLTNITTLILHVEP
jgi:hypothetical protein